jgi:hypothetical protein
MQASKGDEESKPYRRCGGAAIAIAVALCAMVGAAGMLAPPPATAMTSQELATICSSFVTEIGADPSVCVPSLFPRSAGSGESSSYAIEPKPGVVIVIDPKLWNCGGGIYVVPGTACQPRQPKGNRGLGIRLGGEPPSWASPPLGPKERQAAKKDSLKRCALAQMTLRQGKNALNYLRNLQNDRSAWGPQGELLDPEALSRLLANARQWYDDWFTQEIVDDLFKAYPELKTDSYSDFYYLNVLRVGWEWTRDEIEEDLKSPACDHGPDAGKAKSRGKA